MTSEQLASLALSLKDNELWAEALTRIRTDALEALAQVSADDKHGIIRNQAIVKVVDELRDGIERFIRAGQAKKPPGLA